MKRNVLILTLVGLMLINLSSCSSDQTSQTNDGENSAQSLSGDEANQEPSSDTDTTVGDTADLTYASTVTYGEVLFDMSYLDETNAYTVVEGDFDERERELVDTDDPTWGNILAENNVDEAIFGSGTSQVLYRFVTDEVKDISDYEDDGFLVFSLYNAQEEDVTCTLELGSSPDNDDAESQFSGLTAHPGWTNFQIPLSDGSPRSNPNVFDYSNLIRLRIFSNISMDTGEYLLSDVYICHEAGLPGNTSGDDETDVNTALYAAEEGLSQTFPDGVIPVNEKNGVSDEQKQERIRTTIADYLDEWLKDVENIFSVRYDISIESDESCNITFTQNDASEDLNTEINLNWYEDMEPRLIVASLDGASEAIVADIVIGEGDYALDNTGEESASSIIQMALDNCAYEGGGTVYLPAGYYRITDTISIPAYVTLIGDYQDPDEVTDTADLSYGTILLADPDLAGTNDELIFIGGSAGAVGLTVYYPQDLSDIKEYGYTFYNEGQALNTTDRGLHTIKNCTIINGYRGVGLADTLYSDDAANSKPEQTHIINVKGTFLDRGMYNYNASDNGGTFGFTVSPKYWADFMETNTYEALPEDMKVKTVTEDEISAYTKAHTTGLEIGDDEGDYFSNILVEDCLYGAVINPGARTVYYGDFYNWNITGSGVGVQINAISGFGINIACSDISGNDTDLENNTEYPVKLAQVEIDSIAGSGSSYVYKTSDSDLEGNVSDAVRQYGASFSEDDLTVLKSIDDTGKSDVSADIQAALDELGANGGGIVYLPAGHYRLEGSISIPSNTELRGSSSVGVKPTPGVDGGTVLEDYMDHGTEEALILLSGDNAGLSGLMIAYPEQTVTESDYIQTGYAVSSNGHSGVYISNSSIAAYSHGIYFEDCDNFTVEGLTSAIYENVITAVNCRGGQVIRVLQNGTILWRNNWNYSEWEGMEEGTNSPFFTASSAKLDCIVLERSTNVLIRDWFAYRPHDTITLRDGSSVTAINIGAGGAASETDIGSLFVVSDSESSVLSINSHQKNRYSVTDEEKRAIPFGGNVRLYNRMTLMGSTLLEYEGTFRNPSSTDSYTLLDCTDELYWQNFSLDGGYNLSGGARLTLVPPSDTRYADRVDLNSYKVMALDIDTDEIAEDALELSFNGKSVQVSVPQSGRQTICLDLSEFGNDFSNCNIGTFTLNTESFTGQLVLYAVRFLADEPS